VRFPLPVGARQPVDDDNAPDTTSLPGGPDAVEVTARTVTVGADHTTTLAVTGYPSEVGAGWLEPLLSYPGRIDVSLHIDPIPPAVAAARLRKQRARLESSRRADAAHGRLDDPDLDAAADDAAELAVRLARGDGRLFRLGLYVTVHADSPAELDERVGEVRALLASLLVDAVPATWRQLQGWIAGSLPLAVDTLQVRRTVDTDALAASFPLASADLPLDAAHSGSGVLYGLNLASAGVVVWDRWAQDNYNAVILARSGAGKSYLGKLDLLRNLYLGAEAHVIDPEDEYLRLAETIGATVIRPGSPGVRINPLDVPVGEDDALTRRWMFTHTLLAVMLGDRSGGALPDAQAAALDAAVQAAYERKGITLDPRTWQRPAPLLTDLAAALRQQGPAGRDLAARLQPYVSGSFSTLFAGPTTTHPAGPLTVYAFKDLADELKPITTLLTLDQIWRRIASTSSATRRLVVVDEAYLLLRNGIGADWLSKLARRARKYGAGLTLITQDVSDVLATDLGRSVVSNSATQLLLRQAPQAIDAVVDAFGLTHGERAFLLSAGRGDALLAAGSHRVAFHAVADDTEHDAALTSPQFTNGGA
jgi:type IV secretory pathway VirB4 component